MGYERSSRGLWMFRVPVALLAVGLLALVVQRSSSHPASADWPNPTVGHGRTAQGAAIQMRFDRPAHPLAFDDRVHARCSDGGAGPLGWSAFDGTPSFRRVAARCGSSDLRYARYGDGASGRSCSPCARRSARRHAGARMGAADRKLLPRRRREHGVRLGPRAVRDRRAARADARYQCTPFMRLAIATCSIEAFSLCPSRPSRRPSRGRPCRPCAGPGRRPSAPARRPPRRTSPGAC